MTRRFGEQICWNCSKGFFEHFSTFFFLVGNKLSTWTHSENYNIDVSKSFNCQVPKEGCRKLNKNLMIFPKAKQMFD